MRQQPTELVHLRGPRPNRSGFGARLLIKIAPPVFLVGLLTLLQAYILPGMIPAS